MESGDPNFAERAVVVDKVLVDPRYLPAFGLVASPHDVALLHLVDPPSGATIGLDTGDNASLTEVGTASTIIGCGGMRSTESLSIDYPSQLNAASVQIISNEDCRALFDEDALVPGASHHRIATASLCTHNGSTGGCFGDSGGPLAALQNNDWVQLGVVSWGDEDCDPSRPSVYARVASSADWIQGCVDAEGLCADYFTACWDSTLEGVCTVDTEDLDGDGLCTQTDCAAQQTSGQSNAIRVIEEPVGDNCAAGGQRIETGVDTNGNGVLDADEPATAEPVYVCSGPKGSKGCAVASMQTAPLGWLVLLIAAFLPRRFQKQR